MTTEKTLLGLVLKDQTLIDRIADLHPSHFKDEALGKLYGVFSEMHAGGQSVSVMQYREIIVRAERIGLVLAIGDLREFIDFVTIYSDGEAIAAEIIEEKQRHELYGMSEWLSNEIVNGTRCDVLIGQLAEKINAIGSDKGSKEEVCFAEAINEAIQEAENRYRLYQSGKPVGITTGLRGFDDYLRGWQPGSLNIVGGRPGSGKSSCALHFALSAARVGSAGVIFSLEMSTVEMVGKMITPLARGLSYDNYLRGNLRPEDFRGLAEAEAELHQLPITFVDRSNVSVRYVETVVRKLHRQGRCEWVIIDYLQQMRTEKAKNKNREQEISEVTRAMKVLAMELKIPIILLAQLNRNGESRADRMPMLSDLRESGSIEQDADVVCFVHRPAYYGIKEIDTQKYGHIFNTDGVGMLIVAKNRHGATGGACFRHNPELSVIADYYGRIDVQDTLKPLNDKDDEQLF